MDSKGRVLFRLGEYLRSAGYQFTTPTPSTVEIVQARGAAINPSHALRDAFGWNGAFVSGTIPNDILMDLVSEGLCRQEAERFKSEVRYSTIGELIFVHSGFPTSKDNSVFFGPDTYRFAHSIREVSRSFPQFRPRTIVDIGAGSGAGGIVAAQSFASAEHILLTDVNRNALEFCAVNAALNRVASAKIAESNVMTEITGLFDLIISNPPYLVDKSRRLYRHGGGAWGCNLGLRIVQEGLTKLGPGGKLLLYTGTPIVEGKDIFYEAIRPILRACRTAFEYEEIDPDVFGEELTREPYRQAERIAVVRLLIGSPKLGRSRNAA